MGPTYRRLAGLPGIALLAILPGLVGCAGAIATEGEGREATFEHRNLGYRIAAPLGAGGWLRVGVDGTDLAFRSDDGSTLSLLSDCAPTRSSPQLLARNLLIGFDDRQVLRSAPTEIHAAHGWWQSVRARDEGKLFYLESVTLKTDECVFDWVLVSPHPVEDTEWESTFEQWLLTFDWPAALRGGREEQAVAESAP